MKILISSDGIHAHYYQRVAWLKAFRAIGIDAHLWDRSKIPAFDVFDTFEPDVFLGQLYNLDDGLMKCIMERPHLKTGFRAGDWGSHAATIEKDKYNVLTITSEEADRLHRLQTQTGQVGFVHIHYDKDAIKQTHNFFQEKTQTEVLSLPMCADVFEYLKPEPKDTLKCDIGFVGGYWPYKGQVIDQYLTPLCHPIGKYNIKIFGNQPWGHINQYCGQLPDSLVPKLFASAKICPNFSEPHASKYGFDMNERAFKLLCSGAFCISDKVESFCKIFENNGIIFADSPSDFHEKIDYYLEHPSERKEVAQAGLSCVLNEHTSFHRISEVLGTLGFKKDASKAIKAIKELRSQANV